MSVLSTMTRTHRDKTYMWVDIPKNASTSIKEAFTANKWNECCLELNVIRENPIKNVLDEIDEIIVVLRNPINRWISATTQYFCDPENSHGTFLIDGYPQIDVGNEDVLKEIFNTIEFDMHSSPQFAYLDLLEHHINKCTYFKLDDNLTSNFNEYLHSIGCDYKIRHVDKVSIPTHKTVLYELLESNNNYRKIIETHYQRDIELMNITNFYSS